MKNDYIVEALINEPQGAICGFCGKDNDNADDCGWWWINPSPGQNCESKPACSACTFGPDSPGKRHQAYYGVGER